MGSKDAVCTGGSGNFVASSRSIKLFGRTVLVEDSDNSKNVENLLRITPKVSVENLGTNDEKLVETILWKQLETESPFGMVDTSLNLIPSGAQCYQYGELHHKTAHFSEIKHTLPWAATVYPGMPFLNFNAHGLSSGQRAINFLVEQSSKEKEHFDERSCTGSNDGSISELENRERSLDVDSECRKPLREEKGASDPKKGFVPYKRCLVERDASPGMVDAEERERQTARVCL